jgi:hypothetical protein
VVILADTNVATILLLTDVKSYKLIPIRIRYLPTGLENERMIVAKETVWARCREEVNTLLDLLAAGLRSGPTTSEPDCAQRRAILRNLVMDVICYAAIPSLAGPATLSSTSARKNHVYRSCSVPFNITMEQFENACISLCWMRNGSRVPNMQHAAYLALV